MARKITDAKHTRGPWSITGEVEDGRIHVVNDNLGFPVADCGIGTSKIAQANASLIAAAPMMLESLKEMREACAACFRVIAEVGAVDKLEAELIRAGCKEGFGKRAQDIIFKAEGRNA